MDKTAFRNYLLALQDNICEWMQEQDKSVHVQRDAWQRPQGGGGESRVFTGGDIFEKGGVNFSHIKGDSLPASATQRRSDLAGRSYEAMGLSLVIHPLNPYVPTTHANVRMFVAEKDGTEPVWWFGGGYDLTPYYGFEDDCIHWHQTAKEACAPFGATRYTDLKAWCDEYFYVKHRKEARGIGGLFFDDLESLNLESLEAEEGDGSNNFESCFKFVKSVGDSFLPAYAPIVERRKALPWSDRERDFQLYRRGRYVEFNLVHDRGTLFGLQSDGRIESILMSLPPLVRWQYGYQPEAGSPEAALYTDFLPVKEWVTA